MAGNPHHHCRPTDQQLFLGGYGGWTYASSAGSHILPAQYNLFPPNHLSKYVLLAIVNGWGHVEIQLKLSIIALDMLVHALISHTLGFYYRFLCRINTWWITIFEACWSIHYFHLILWQAPRHWVQMGLTHYQQRSTMTGLSGSLWPE